MCNSPEDYDAGSSVARIIRDLDELAGVPGTPVVINMMMVIDKAASIAVDWLEAAEEEFPQHALRYIQYIIATAIDQDD